jgi:hypothetical protein
VMPDSVSGPRLVDRLRAGPGGEHVPFPGGDGSLGPDQVRECVAVRAGVSDQSGSVRAGLPLVSTDGAGRQVTGRVAEPAGACCHNWKHPLR